MVHEIEQNGGILAFFLWASMDVSMDARDWNARCETRYIVMNHVKYFSIVNDLRQVHDANMIALGKKWAEWKHSNRYYQIELDWYWFQKHGLKLEEGFRQMWLWFEPRLIPSIGCIDLPFQIDTLVGLADRYKALNWKFEIHVVSEMNHILLWRVTKFLRNPFGSSAKGFLNLWCGAKTNHIKDYCKVESAKTTSANKFRALQQQQRSSSILICSIPG